jgi:hypothetical protein
MCLQLVDAAKKATAEARNMELAADKLKAEAARKEAEARKVLEGLYADRADGRDVTTAQINKASAALSAAVEETKRAGPEEAGYRAAAAKSSAKAAEAQRALANLRNTCKELFRSAMHGRIRESCKELDTAIEEFSAVYTRHHAEMNAIEDALQRFGYPHGDGEFFANHGSAVIELPITRTKTRPYNFTSVDLSKQMQKEVDRYAAELRELMP